MTRTRFPVTLVDLVGHSLQGTIDTGCVNWVARLSGRIDEARLERAIRLMMDAEPVLGCKYVDHWYAPWWQRRDDLDRLSLLRVVPATPDAPELARFLAEPIDVVNDPLIKIMVLRDQNDTVCVKSTHTVGDGPSAARLLFFVVDTYRRLKSQPEYVPPVNSEGVRDMRHVVRHFSLRQRLELIKGLARDRRLPPGSWLFPECRGENRFRGYVMLKLPVARVRALSRFGRDRRATMTSVILAGIYLAARRVFRLTNPEAALFSTTTDMRRFLPVSQRNTAAGNMSAPGRFLLDPRRDGDFEQVLLEIRDQLKEIVKDPTRMASLLTLLTAIPVARSLANLLPASWLCRRIRALAGGLAARPQRRWTLANLGKFDADLINLEDVAIEDSYMTGPIYSAAGVMITLSIFQERLTLSLGISDRLMEESVARQLLEEVDRQLPAQSIAAGQIVTLNGLA